MNDTFKAATTRSLYGALLTATLTFLTTYQTLTSVNRFEDAAIAAGTTFLGYMIARGAAEGLIDSARQSSGSVTPADVGAYQQPLDIPARVLHGQ